jgi:predicted nuclease of predicted toxin-antitoxin system
MPVRLYLDVHVPRAIAVELRRRGVDVLTAQDDGATRLADPDLLDRATALDRVLFSQDDDFLSEATRRQREDIPFVGVVYGHQLRVAISVCVRDLELIAKLSEADELRNRVEHLPL